MRARRLSLILLAIASALPAQVLNIGPLAGSTDGGGYVDGPRSTARFSDPSGVAADSAGNLFVVDTANQVIRKIAPDGTVSTFAGTPHIAGSKDGKPGTFLFPQGLAVDKTTNDVYVADTYNSTIRKITPAGVVSTVAGSALHPDRKSTRLNSS